MYSHLGLDEPLILLKHISIDSRKGDEASFTLVADIFIQKWQIVHIINLVDYDELLADSLDKLLDARVCITKQRDTLFLNRASHDRFRTLHLSVLLRFIQVIGFSWLHGGLSLTRVGVRWLA